MQAVIRKSDNVAVYLFETPKQIEITATGMIGDVRALDIRSSTHELVSVTPLGEPFAPGAHKWDNDRWSVADDDSHIDGLKDARKQAVNAVKDAKFAAGYSHDFGGATGVKTLDTRGVDDRTNWLTAQALYGAQIAAGNGDVAGATIRTADNTDITLTFTNALNVVLALGANGAAIMQRSWALKNAIDAASTVAEVAAIDIESGWP